jgi:uncharacterized protein YkwD
MAITNQQGTGRKPTTKAEKAAAAEAVAANEAEVRRSVNQWRVMQGLPPLEVPDGKK